MRAVLSTASVATVTINDDDVEIGFSPVAYRVSEVAGSVELTVSVLSGDIDAGVNVEVTVMTMDEGSAVAGVDYTATTATLTFTSSVTEATVTVFITDDAVVEDEETFVVELSGDRVPSGSSVARVTIMDDDVEIGFSPVAYSVSEVAGSVELTVSVLSGDIDAGVNVEVTVRTMDESAIAGEDYTATTATLTFTSSMTEATVTVFITDDAVVEGEETFVVELSGDRVPSVSSVARVTITDDDVEIGFSPVAYSVSEVAGSVELTVSVLSGDIDAGVNVEVTVMTMDESAIAGEDYTATTATLTFTSSVTEATVTVFITDDAVVEGEETFVVELSGDRVPSSSSVARVTINDDDVEIGFSSVAYSVSEDAGSVELTVSVLSGDIEAGVNVEVTFMTMDESAVAGVDYTATTATLTLTSSMTEATVTVFITDDAVVEGEETFVVELSGENVLATASVATVMIEDADVLEIGFDPIDYSVSEDADSVMLGVSVFSGELAEGVSAMVNVMTMDGSAIAGEDYSEFTDTLTFTSEVTTQTVSVSILPDGNPESDEVFSVKFGGCGRARYGKHGISDDITQ